MVFIITISKYISVTEVVEGIKELYTPTLHKWTSIEKLGEQVKWLHLTAQTSAEYMTSQGIPELFIHEFHESMTRVNYGQVGVMRNSFGQSRLTFMSLANQNTDEIHGLMGLVSMATDGAVGIEGGNFQVFEHFLNRSGADVHLGTKVC